MCNLSAVSAPGTVRRKAGRFLALAVVAIVALALGCSPDKRYKVLSAFFDGVPDPSAPKVASNMSGMDNLTPNQFKGAIVSTHKPYAAGKCDACHAPMEDNVPSVQTVIDSSVCLKCHEVETRRHAFMHAPVAAGACLFCHNPHNSTQPHLLLAPTPGLCMQCHDRSLLGDNPPAHRNENSACLDCHVGHGEETRGFFLRASNAPKPSHPTTAPAPWVPIDQPDLRPATRPAPAGATPPVAAAPTTAPSLLTQVPARPGSGSGEYRMPYLIGSDPTPAPVVRPVFLADAAAEEGPVAIGELHRPPVFGLGDIDTALDVRYRYEHDTLKSRQGVNSSSTENRIDEDLSLSTTAYVIHPNFLDIKITGDFGARQDWEGAGGSTAFTNEALYDYNVEGTFLRKENAPLTVYSRRSEDTISQPFGPSIDETIQTTGAYIDIKLPKSTTHVEAYHSDQDQSSIGQEQSYTLSQNVFSANSTYELAATSRLAAAYTFNNNYETTSLQGYAPTSNAFNTHDASISHSYTFGPRELSDLNSSLSFYDQTGQFALERLTENEALHLTHSDTFQTRYLYTLNYQSTDTSSIGPYSQTENDFNTGFTHHLFQSLITSGDAGLRYIDRSDDSGAFGYYGSIRVDYTKKIPFGRLSADIGYTFDQQNNREQNSVVHVVNEAHTVTLPQPIILTSTAVVASSLVVRNTTGLIIYVEGVDYQVRAASGFVEISIILGGRITDGQTILLNYDLSAQPANRVTDNTYNASVRYDIQMGLFTGVGLYGRWIKLDQTIDSSTINSFIPNSLNDYALGADYRRGELTVGAEHEWHQSTVQPYNADRYYVRYNHRAAPNLSVGADIEYSDFDYYTEPDRVEYLQASANVSRSITSELTGTLSGTYLNDNDHASGTTNGYQATAELDWTHRQTHFYLQVRESILDGPAQSTSFESVWFGLRRKF
jgi:predicted CXXCH cytochrome family protein